jgi:hypothetical protein
VQRWSRSITLTAAALFGMVAANAWTAPTRADVDLNLPLARPGTRFVFEIIESVDAAYLGDTPGHMGRAGGLNVRPNVALEDAVYRTVGETTERIGSITRVKWERASGGLTLEFDPAPQVRVAVGDVVWIDLNPIATQPPAGK